MKRKHGRLRSVPDTASFVEGHLAVLLGSSTLARTILVKALAHANLEDVPEHPEALLALCSTHLLPAVAPLVSSAEVAIFLREFQSELEEAFGSPIDFERPSEPDDCVGERETKSNERSGARGKGEGLRVLLVEEDSLIRVAIARALVRLGATVLVATDTLDEVTISRFAGANMLVCDLDAPRSVFALLELGERLPELSVVARAEAADLGVVTLKLAGIRRHRILGRRPRDAEIVASVLTLWRDISDPP